MIARPEYTAHAKNLQKIAQDHAVLMRESLDDVTTLQTSVKVGRIVADSYASEAREAIIAALREIAEVSIAFYAGKTGNTLSDDQMEALVGEVISGQLELPYYGATLEQRFVASRRLLHGRLTRSSRVGLKLQTRQENLARLFTEHYPFGAHVLHDKRILLGQAQLIQQDIAKHFADDTEHKLIRWTLSDHHTMKDECDELAERENDNVKDYLASNNLTIKAKGVYFVDKLPKPPHPNCQCNFIIVTSSDEERPNVIQRAVGRISKWIRGIFD